MKTISTSILLLCLLCSYSSFAQTRTTKPEKFHRPIETRKNEFKLGVVKLLAIPAMDLEYERILTTYSSVGGNIVVNFNGDDGYYNFSASPYFRMYFTQTKEYGTKGFFAQAFMGYFNASSDDYIYDSSGNYVNTSTQNTDLMAAGLSIGFKLVNKEGFVFQLLGGIGRKIVGNEYAQEMVYQADVYVGYRF